MKSKAFALAVCLALTAGCATTQHNDRASSLMSPFQAVQLAAAAAPKGVPGTFAMRVQGVGAEGTVVYLNSELDYRDQRNLSVDINAAAARQLEDRLGSPPAIALKGREILVTGQAIRVKIVFYANGMPTAKYYYQTHVRVSDGQQIQLVGG